MQADLKLTVEELSSKYSKLLKDIEFDKLELESAKPNLFHILGATHNELRHSNMLSWLLNTNESHGIGEAFLKRFLREVAQDDKSALSQLETEKLPFELVEIRREWNNIDVLIIFPEHVIAIENKIWAGETGNQLERYKQIINDHFSKHKKSFVFLTPFGHEPEIEADTYINLSYQIVVDALERIMEIKGDDLTPRMHLLIEDYIQIIKRNIMNEDDAVKMAQEIYKNHKELFNFVFEHKPDFSEEIRPELEKLIKAQGWEIGSKNKGYVRFSTPALNSLIKPYKKGDYRDNEVFQFEIDYWWGSETDTRIFFKLVIAPGDNEGLKNRLQEIIEAIPNSGKATGKKWLTYFKKKQKYKMEDLEEEVTNISIAFEKIKSFIEETVNSVETAILAKAEELKELQ